MCSSDWSSDVCSSDLNVVSAGSLDIMDILVRHPAINPTKSKHWALDVTWLFPNFQFDVSPGGFWTHHFWPVTYNSTRWEARFHIPVAGDIWTRLQQEHYVARLRSEEHTSELQSLMPIPYAV